MIKKKKNYNELLNVFDDYYNTNKVLTLFWENGTVLKGISEVGSGETDTDLPEESPAYPGYYSTFLDNIEAINIDKKDLDFSNRYGSLEIDMITAPMLVKVDDEIVWEKEKVK
ncbi:hypothetical protein [Lactococcus garvieae]